MLEGVLELNELSIIWIYEIHISKIYCICKSWLNYEMMYKIVKEKKSYESVPLSKLKLGEKIVYSLNAASDFLPLTNIIME